MKVRSIWADLAQVMVEMLALLVIGGIGALVLALLVLPGCALQTEFKITCDVKCDGPCAQRCVVEGERALDAKLPNPIPMQ